MNRAERRKMIKTIPGHKKTLKSVTKKVLKSATEKAVNDLKIMFQRKWEEDDETLNNGERSYNNDGEDDIYNS